MNHVERAKTKIYRVGAKNVSPSAVKRGVRQFSMNKGGKRVLYRQSVMQDSPKQEAS